MNITNTEVFNFEGAFRGMRNPLNSWEKSDSVNCAICTAEGVDSCPYVKLFYCCFGSKNFIIGENDMNLAKRLINGGSEHRKFLRQIFVSADITAPLYIWKELDTYKVGTTANSTSTMHKLASTPITLDCFEIDDLDDCSKEIWNTLIPQLEALRVKYNETKDKKYWKELVRLLPEGWLQTRTWTANYEILYNIYKQRKGHKLTEWKYILNWITTVPYFKEFFDISENS